MQTSNKELILLVDDDPGNLKRAQTILGEEFRISATTSGKMALSLLSKVTPDLILLDVNMPEMNGFITHSLNVWLLLSQHPSCLRDPTSFST